MPRKAYVVKNKSRKLPIKRGLIWYRGVKEGSYTIQELVKKTGFSYDYISQNLKRMGVEQFIPEDRFKNQICWKFKGEEFYIKQEIKKRCANE